MSYRGRATSIRDVPYDPLNFTASAGTWTVDSADLQTLRLAYAGGGLYTLMLRLNTTTVSVAPNSLIMKLPFGLVARQTLYQLFMANPTALPTEAALVEILQGGTTMQFQRLSGNWVAGVNQTYISGVIHFEAT